MQQIEKFLRYQQFIFRLLQSDILNLAEQNELFDLQKRSVKNNVPVELEQLFRTPQLLNLQQRIELIERINCIFQKFTNKTEIQAFLTKLLLFKIRFESYNNCVGGKMAFEFRRKWLNNLKNRRAVNYGFSAVEQECYEQVYKILPDFKPNTAANIAVAEYTNPQGQIDYVMRVSVHNKINPPEGDKHSEQRIFAFLANNNINPDNVLSWYSEIQPCNVNKNCRKEILENTPKATVKFCFLYNPSEIKKHQSFIHQIFKL